MNSRDTWSPIRQELNNYFCPITVIVAVMDTMGVHNEEEGLCPCGYDCMPCATRHLKEKNNGKLDEFLS